MDSINMDEREQWKISGDCRICRRKDYCTEKCRLSKEKFEAEVRDFVLEKTGFYKIMNMLNSWRN